MSDSRDSSDLPGFLDQESKNSSTFRLKHQQTFDVNQPSNVVEKFVDQEYSFEHYDELAKRAQSLLEKGLNEVKDEVQAKLTYRAKDPKSLREKLRVRDQTRHYLDSSAILDDVKDLAGVRIILYTPDKTQRRLVKNVINGIWDDVEEIPHGDPLSTRVAATVPDDKITAVLKGGAGYVEKHLGYQAYHYRARMLKSQENGDTKYKWKSQDRVEIQVVSALGHAWAEASHDVMYKTHAYGRPTTTERRILDALNGLITSGDLLLEQFRKSVLKRTYKEWRYTAQLEIFLRKSDILHIDSTGLQDRFATECMDVLFRFLLCTGKNIPIAVRNALIKLGYPEKPASKLEDVSPELELGTIFEAKKGYIAPLCLIVHFILKDKIDIRECSDLEKCNLMLDALLLLQFFADSPGKGNAFLREMDMTSQDRESLNFVLQNPHREDCQYSRQGQLEESISQTLQRAWEWFENQAKEDRLCGIFFRLALMGVPAKELPNLQERIKKLEMGSLSHHVGITARDEPQ